VTVSLHGLSGGHSGTDIDKGLANANKLMNRFLFEAGERFAVRIASIDGGGLRNAIPRESRATLAVPVSAQGAWGDFVAAQEALFRAEYGYTDPNWLAPPALPRPWRQFSTPNFKRAFCARSIPCLAVSTA